MLRFNIFLGFFFVFAAIFAQNKKSISQTTSEKAAQNTYFGLEFDQSKAVSASEMATIYEQMRATDTIKTKFKAIVTDVCQAKGCWMKLALGDGSETMVRFKDYAFFMPVDLKGREVMVNGFAYVEEMSVEDQRHYAKDGGKSEADILKITSVKKSLSFEADGVFLKK